MEVPFVFPLAFAEVAGTEEGGGEEKRASSKES